MNFTNQEVLTSQEIIAVTRELRIESKKIRFAPDVRDLDGYSG